FSFSNDNPYRIEFFGNEVESIRSFDVETQLSIEKQKKITIIPNVENKFFRDKRESFFDYISPNTVLCIHNAPLVTAQIGKLYDRATESFEKLDATISHVEPGELFIDEKSFRKQVSNFSIIEVGQESAFKSNEPIKFSTSPQPSFNKQFDLLLNNLG